MPTAPSSGRSGNGSHATVPAKACSAKRKATATARIFGAGRGSARWIVDPIDGTRNFSRGIPVWATLLALERDGALVLGVVSAPALGRRWWAARGAGAFANGERIVVSQVQTLAEASVSCSEARDLAQLEPHVWHARGLGDFWQHVLVAEGALDAAVDVELALWDRAALEPIVEEAGGRVGFVNGRFVSSNGRVHDAVAQCLNA